MKEGISESVLVPLSLLPEKCLPFAERTVKISGGDQRLRTSTLIRDRPDRGEEQDDLRGESDESSLPLQDSSQDGAEAGNDFLHHVEPRCIDVTRGTSSILVVMLERHTDDYWNIEGDRDRSDSWTGFTRLTILDEKPPDGHTWSGKRPTKRKTKVDYRKTEG